MRQFTFIETLANFVLPVGIAHLHVFMVVSQLVNALLAEGHQQHIYGDACHSVVLRLDVSILPFSRVPLRLPFSAFEFTGIGQWL